MKELTIPEKRKIAVTQTKQLMNRMTTPSMLRVSCAECGDVVNMLWAAYKCFYCKLYFCSKCAENHFKTKKPGVLKSGSIESEG
jgi:predicted nucleic acid binding AN1-type Zn finger protein